MTWNEAVNKQIQDSGHDFRKLKCEYREVYWEKVANIYAKAAIEKDREFVQNSILNSVVGVITREREITLP